MVPLSALGGKCLDTPGYDLMGVFVGSERHASHRPKVTLRIVKTPECIRRCWQRRGNQRSRPRGQLIIAARNVAAAIE